MIKERRLQHMAFYDDLDVQHIHTKLSHLSTQEVELLVKAYYEEMMPVVNLIAYYALDVQPNTLTQYFPDAFVHEHCELCGHTPLLLPLQNRSQIRRMNEIDTMRYCPICEHHDKMQCHCDACLKEQQMRYQMFQLTEDELNEKEQTQIAAFLTELSHTSNEIQLTRAERFYVTGLLQLAYDKEKQQIMPLCNYSEEFTPSKVLTTRILKDLVDRRILLPCLENSLSTAFHCEDINFLRTLHDPNYWSGKWTVAEQEAAYTHFEKLRNKPPIIHYEEAAFRLNMASEEIDDLFIARTEGRMFYQRMWKELAMAHGEFYAAYCKLPTPLQKIDDALDKHSISEVYTFIQRGFTSSNIEKSARIKPISRLENLLFTQMMGIGEDGFFTRPTFI